MVSPPRNRTNGEAGDFRNNRITPEWSPSGLRIRPLRQVFIHGLRVVHTSRWQAI
jgi:hypothetical protein